MVYGRKNYYKRKSLHRRAVCPSCRSDVFLHSYNATRCFQACGIPLFPVAQHRVFDNCPACGASTEGPLREWTRLRLRDLAPAMESLRRNPADPAAARYALALATRLDSADVFDEIAAAFLAHHFQDALLLAELGAAFHHFGRAAEGNDALRRSLAIREDPSVRRYLDFFESPAPPRPAPLPHPARRLLPLAVAPAILLAALLLLGKAAFLGTPRHLYLVNGIDRPYEVLLNGERLRIDAMSRVRLEPGPRAWRIEPVPGGAAIAPFARTLRAPLFNRGAARRVVVFNPDRAGLLLCERAVYESAPAAADSPVSAPRRFHVGEPLYVFEDIDRAFQPLPDQLEETPARGRATLEGLRQVTRFDPPANARLVLENGQRDTALEYIRRGLHHHPDDDDFLMLLAAMWPAEDAIAFLEERLEERPVLAEWHRYYQELSARHRPEVDLVTAYRRLHTAEPADHDLAYLLGRLLDDPAESRGILEAASRPPRASPHALHALAFDAMNRGRFDEALDYERRALGLLPGKLRFRALEEEMLLATGSYNELIKRRRAAFAADESDRDAAAALASLLALAGETSEARAVADRHRERAGAKDARTAALFDAVLAGSTRDFAAFTEAAALVGFGDWPWYAALASRDLVRALALLRENPSPTWREHLLLYTLAVEENLEGVARDHLDDTIELLREGGPRERLVAGWFRRGAIAPGLEEVYRVRQWPSDSRIVLAALGVRFPRMREIYHAPARRMNYDPAFPGPLLAQLLEKTSTAARHPE